MTLTDHAKKISRNAANEVGLRLLFRVGHIGLIQESRLLGVKFDEKSSILQG